LQETSGHVVLENAPTSVTDPGTPFNPENMNKIERGIYDAHEMIAAEAEARVNADNALYANIQQRAAKASNATAGNFAGLDAGGNLSDSGKKAADFVPAGEKGAAGGVATLNANGTIPSSQIPNLGQGLQSVVTDGTLQGNGTSGSPLKIPDAVLSAVDKTLRSISDLVSGMSVRGNLVYRNIVNDPRFPGDYGVGVSLISGFEGNYGIHLYMYSDGLYVQWTADGADIVRNGWIKLVDVGNITSAFELNTEPQAFATWSPADQCHGVRLNIPKGVVKRYCHNITARNSATFTSVSFLLFSQSVTPITSAVMAAEELGSYSGTNKHLACSGVIGVNNNICTVYGIFTNNGQLYAVYVDSVSKTRSQAALLADSFQDAVINLLN